MNIYFDTEFTGLVPNTTLISLGMVAETGEKFYAEFTDYNRDLVTDWIQENVIENLYLFSSIDRIETVGNLTKVVGDTTDILIELKHWLRKNFHDQRIQLVSDVCHYDMYLLCNQVFGGAFNLPENINPVCYDICQDLVIYEMHDLCQPLDSAMEWAFNVSREDICKRINIKLPEDRKHNALYDAEVIKMIHEGNTPGTLIWEDMR